MSTYSRVSSLWFSFLLLLFLYPSRVLAACGADETDVDIACLPNTAAGFSSKFYGIGLGLIGGVSILFIILGGYFILTSGGDAGRLATGRSYITYAIIGLLLAIFGYIFISVIAVDILRIPGFN